MFSAFFGHYLLEKKIVTARQLDKAMNRQEKTRLKLGVLAVGTRLMTAVQAQEVNELQATMDKRFGDIAVEKGYLTADQVQALLSQQAPEHLALAQSLIDTKAMTMARYEKEIENYRKQFGMDDEQFEALKNNDVDLLVHAFLAFEDTDMTDYYSIYTSLFVKNVIRFLDGHICFDRVIKVEQASFDHLVRQNISGDQKIFTALGLSTDTFLKLAGKYADETFDEVGEYPIDAAGEFLNLHNGLYTVNMSDAGLDLKFDIQSYIEAPILNPSAGLYQVPLHTGLGEINLLIGQLY